MNKVTQIAITIILLLAQLFTVPGANARMEHGAADSDAAVEQTEHHLKMSNTQDSNTMMQHDCCDEDDVSKAVESVKGCEGECGQCEVSCHFTQSSLLSAQLSFSAIKHPQSAVFISAIYQSPDSDIFVPPAK